MRRHHLNRLFHVLIPAILSATVLFAAISPSLAQSAATATATPSANPNDDSNELPIYVTVTGYVQDVRPTSVRINDLTIILPAGMDLPPGIEVGKVASLRGNLRNDDTILIIVIVPGYHLPPTPTPTAVATGQATAPATETATEQPTMAATGTEEPEGTEQPTGTPVAGCNKPGQKLGLMLSAAYAIPYQQIADLHCKGYSFGEIGRAFLLVVAGDDEGKNVTIAVVLSLRGKHHRWSEIIIILGVDPDSTLIIFVIDGGHATFFVDCGGKNNPKKSRYCGRVSGGGGGNQGGDNKGKKEDND